MHWSRHLLANIRQGTCAELLIGASAVTYNPHFRQFISPLPGDARLRAVSKWPPVSALLVLDSFAHPVRARPLQSAAAHQARGLGLAAVHFDVICPLLIELRQWTGRITI